MSRELSRLEALRRASLKSLNKKSPTPKDIHNNFNVDYQKGVKRVRERVQRIIDKPTKVYKSDNNLNYDIEDFKHSLFSVPNWFVNKDNVDVSIIIPLYKSSKFVEKQINFWHFDSIKSEIIYVDDGCPENSKEIVLKTWNKKPTKIGRIITNDRNYGYGPACNIGASYALGKYLIFLNADTIISENWISPMYELFFDPLVGIVGNLQLKFDETVDSAGSEWDWNGGNFPHIGRNIYQGKGISTPLKFNNLPINLKEVSSRDMVTGCCFMIPRNLFIDLEGFDLNYHIGYWEDSDLNMKVKESGYKILYQPNSKIYHSLGHSSSGGHKFANHNREFFKKRWVDSGRIDKLVSKTRPGGKINKTLKNNINGEVVGCIIACNEEEFLEASVDSIAPMVDRFVLVIGGNEYAYKAGMCHSNGLPTDSTLEIANRLVGKYPGIVIPPPGRLWKDKVEMRNAYVKHLKPGNWMFMLDGDEVYKERQLWRLTELMKDYDCLILQFWLFWNNMNTIGTGSWEKYPQERLVKWRDGFGYRGDNHLHVSDKHGNLVNSKYPTYRGQEKLFYHYSWVRPIDKIVQKRRYYEFQSNIKDDNYVQKVFLQWRKNPYLVKETHPKSGGGTKPFLGIHPVQVQELINTGKLNF